MNEKDADWLVTELAAAEDAAEAWGAGLKEAYASWLASDGDEE